MPVKKRLRRQEPDDAGVHMKYGIYYAYWEKQWGADYERYIDKVSALGFDILEISCAGLSELTEKDIDRLNEARKRTGIILTGGYGPKASENLSSADREITDNGFRFWKDTFPVMEKLGITSVGGGLYGYWPVDYTKPFSKEAELERSISNMRKLADMAAEYGITTMGMEVLNRHEGYLINTSRECVDYVKAVDRKNVKVMLDTYHMLLEENSFTEAIQTAGKYLGHLHAGENNRKVPGQGHMIDWNEIGSALKNTGYNGNIVMEPFVIQGGEVGRDIRVWRDLLEDTSETKLDQEARESLLFLKKYLN